MTKETKKTKGKADAAGSFGSLLSLRSSSKRSESRFIPPHGGYQNLLSYQKALIVYDATQHFCNRFFGKFDRTRDQMIQAARSGKQNILEGSKASGTSKESEIKLTNTARASQGEQLEDYRDFMRHHGIEEWASDHPHAQRLRELNRTSSTNYQTFKKGIEHADPAICTNVIVGLIKVTSYLLDRQLDRLEQDFVKDGGLRERMTRARLAARHSQERH
ncbi:MAG: four helix bundle suffix domain-containing protein [Verrucomicrobia bacterium]|nr:four helix bundle suffix domain-containing protein [Verrucomicrobiota bacterium]